MKLRQVDVLVSQGRSTAEAVRSIGVTQFTYYLYGRPSRCKSIFDLICLASCKHLSGVTR